MYDFEELNKNPGKAPKTVNPAKKFFYRRMYRDIEADGPIESMIDYACGRMDTLDNIAVVDYTGVDVLEWRLVEGQQKHPNTKTFAGRIQDYEVKTKVQAVICVEVLGINTLFENDEIIEVIEKISSSVRKGGNLYFNVGPEITVNRPEVVNKVDQILATNFSDVNKTKYGRFDAHYTRTRARLRYLLMRLVPWSRFSAARPRYYYCCRGKI
jgi:hypothetical protein